MRPDAIRRAVEEARRFLDRADAALQTVESLPADNKFNPGYEYIPQSRKSGSLRRASLELSSALVEMRQ